MSSSPFDMLGGAIAANTVLLSMFVSWASERDPNLEQQFIASFDDFLGRMHTEAGEEGQPAATEMLVEARKIFRTIVDNAVPLKETSQPRPTLRRKFINWLERG